MNMSAEELFLVASAIETTVPIMICLLGSFLLLSEGQPVALRQGGKSEALLVHLGLQACDGIPRDTLLQLLWPHSDTALASQALHSLVHSLHRLFGNVLGGSSPVVHENGRYRLNVAAGVAVDVSRFDALAKRGDRQAHTGDSAAAISSYNNAVDLYRGELCLGEDLHTLVERERLRVRYLTLLAKLADYYYGVCDYPMCLEFAWRLLRCDPCREDAHRLVMRCYVRQGRRSQALGHYRFCVEILHGEFGAAPENATTALFDQVRLNPDTI